MSIRSRPISLLVLMIVVGCILGSLFGELIGLILPQGVIRDFFVKGVKPGFDPLHVDIGILAFTIAFRLKVTVASVLGIWLAMHIFRWY